MKLDIRITRIVYRVEYWDSTAGEWITLFDFLSQALADAYIDQRPGLFKVTPVRKRIL